jgi:HEAT repeat protein
MTDLFDILITQLQSPDPFQRSQAALQLQPGGADDDRAVTALVNVLCTDPDLNVVEDATWVLVRYGAVATAALLNEVSHEHPRARHNAVHALGKIGDAQAVPNLMAATQDADAAVRLKSVYSLGQISDTRAIESLILRLDDPVQNVQWTAREVLESFGERALPGLIRALNTESAQVRELSASLLGDIADNSAVDPLIAAADTDDWHVKVAVVEALGTIGDGRALPLVERLTGDADSRVRAIANAVLKTLSRAQK